MDPAEVQSTVYSSHPPPKKNGCQIVCPESFFGRYNELQIYHGNFLLMDIKHRKLFVIKPSDERLSWPSWLTTSFTLGLNPYFSANPPYRSLSFFFFRIHYMDFPDCLLLLLSISVSFYFLVFFCFYTFLVVGSVR